MNIIVVVERDYSLVDPDMRDRYIGGTVCRSFEAARELVFAHQHSRRSNYEINYVENGVDYIEISSTTGEIFAEFFVRLIGHD